MNITIGKWSNGEEIDITGVPRVQKTAEGCGSQLVQNFEAANGGTFSAIYDYVSGSTRQDRKGRRMIVDATYALSRVEEMLPPRPPQIQGFSDDVRLPMMDENGYSDITAEAEQRKAEWAEALSIDAKEVESAGPLPSVAGEDTLGRTLPKESA